jgi:hypothetical protein
MSSQDSTINPLMSSVPIISSQYLQNIEHFMNETMETKYVGLNYTEIIKVQIRNLKKLNDCHLHYIHVQMTEKQKNEIIAELIKSLNACIETIEIMDTDN